MKNSFINHKTILLVAILGLGLFVAYANKNTCKTMCDQTAKTITFTELSTKRHSGYSYDPNRPVSQDQIEALKKAAQSAPSSFNDQPWNVIICDRSTNPESYQKLFDTLVEFNQKWAKNASVLVAIIASTNSHENEFNRWAQYDSGAAAFAMMLQATDLGLMAHQMGGFDPEKVRKAFNISADFVPMAVMAVGYETADQQTKAVEKQRKALSENFFMGTWK